MLEEVAIVIEAKNGQNAVDMYKEYSPALTFLDIHMPVKDGKEALREILEINPKAYVIMFSADAVKDNVLRRAMRRKGLPRETIFQRYAAQPRACLPGP